MVADMLCCYLLFFHWCSAAFVGSTDQAGWQRDKAALSPVNHSPTVVTAG